MQRLKAFCPDQFVMNSHYIEKKHNVCIVKYLLKASSWM